MKTPEQNLAFYQQLFTETLFVVPEKASVPGKEKDPVQPETGAKPVDPEEKFLTAKAVDTEKNYVLSGQNLKGLVLIFRLPESDFINLQQNTFLLNILKAIGHGPADVGFVNLQPDVKIDIKALQQDLLIKSFIGFGMKFQATDKPYIPQLFEGIPYIISEALANMENDREKKGKFWAGLQQIYLNKN